LHHPLAIPLYSESQSVAPAMIVATSTVIRAEIIFKLQHLLLV
jgi:hypothetical protein